LCAEPAVVEAERAADMGMTMGAEHLGPILRYTSCMAALRVVA
jgi:hypothetical protein